MEAQTSPPSPEGRKENVVLRQGPGLGMAMWCLVTPPSGSALDSAQGSASFCTRDRLADKVADLLPEGCLQTVLLCCLPDRLAELGTMQLWEACSSLLTRPCPVFLCEAEKLLLLTPLCPCVSHL